jgi:protein-arginine kinase activator protein McsA
MKCDRCDNPATVHLIDVRDARPVEQHLCESCTRQREGLSFPRGTDPAGNPVVVRCDLSSGQWSSR